ncbi:MAG TPA: transglutaminase N-terminal domain-containing protein [Burkholderiales bacterium]|nr:transglutaminase N-terminal domain-containing protein [Burkholderiales bacterium]
MRLAIAHETRYAYDSPVRYSAQYLRLTPRDTARQKVLGWKLDTPGQPVRTQDGYGNVLHVLTLDRPVSEIVIRVSGVVQTDRTLDEPSDFTGVTLPPLVFVRATALTRADGELQKLAEGFRARSTDLAGLRELADAVRDAQPGCVPEGLTHAFLAGCRLLGVPARYVSGYLCAADGGAALHSWAEAWIGEHWRSFDIAQGGPIGERHIKLAVGADQLDACPIRGVRTGGGLETMSANAEARQ